MALIHVSAERVIQAPPTTVYSYIADLSLHPSFLPPEISQFTIESGGVGAGTVISYVLTAGGRVRNYNMSVTEPEPGRVLSESDANTSLVTTFTVEPSGDSSHEHSSVRIDTTWQGASGIGGFFERTFAPKALRKIYEDSLERLDIYAIGRAASI